MAEDTGTESAPAESTAPATGSQPDAAPAPSAPTAEQPSLSFADNLARAVKPEAVAAPAVDFDARLAEERQKWQTEADQRYGWAKDLQPDQVTSWRQAIEEAQNDPVETATRLLAASLASGNPQHRQKALSFAGRLLAGHTGQSAPSQVAPAETEPGPDIPARGLNGEDLQLYSGPQFQKALKYHLDKFKAELTGELGPLKQAHQTQQEREQYQEQQRQLVGFAQSIYDRVSKRPQFNENRDAIREAWMKMPGNDEPYTAQENLNDAYAQVVFGKLRHSLDNATAADSARRAAASTGRVVTAQPTQTSPAAPLSFAEKLATEMAKRKGA